MVPWQTIMRVKQGVLYFLLLIFMLNPLILLNTFITYDLILKSILILSINNSFLEKYFSTTITFTIFLMNAIVSWKFMELYQVSKMQIAFRSNSRISRNCKTHQIFFVSLKYSGVRLKMYFRLESLDAARINTVPKDKYLAFAAVELNKVFLFLPAFFLQSGVLVLSIYCWHPCLTILTLRDILFSQVIFNFYYSFFNSSNFNIIPPRTILKG